MDRLHPELENILLNITDYMAQAESLIDDCLSKFYEDYIVVRDSITISTDQGTYVESYFDSDYDSVERTRIVGY